MTMRLNVLADAEARHLVRAALDQTLVVEAAAGTGKTTELVARIVQVLAAGRADVGEIVAVTFTEKAAGELKLRLRERLDRERTAAVDDAQTRARLDKALTGLEEAHIGTIHGFCADLLRERPVEARVDPLFEVLTESASARLFESAFNSWLQEQLVSPSEGVLRALHRSAFAGGDGPIDRVRKAAWDLAQWRDYEGAWTRNAWNREGAITELISDLERFADLSRKSSSRMDSLFVGTDAVRRLSDEIALQRSPGELTTSRDFDNWESSLVDLSRDRALMYIKQGRGAVYGPGVSRADVWAALTQVRAQLDGFRMDADADLAAALQHELRGALDYYAREKSKHGALDFLDLLLKARDLVRDNEHVRSGFQQRFKRIFVDEFQDTDPLQAEILLLLAASEPAQADWRSVSPVPGRLFIVGDPKQSIYRFRRADVSVYRDVCRQLIACGAIPLQLVTSFRSTPEIQACVNAAFRPVMTGDESTLQASYVPLQAHRPGSLGQPSLVALPVPEPYAKRYVTAGAIEKSLPDAVGAFVEWLIESSGWKVIERTDGVPVAVSPKHICLLFRRFTSFETDVTRSYIEALEARGIPHVLVGGKAFHEREEVEAIQAALAAIEWPDDELSVFATLRGPFFAIQDEDLMEWAWRFGRHVGGAFRRQGFHPFRIPQVFDGHVPSEVAHLAPIADVLRLLKRLHRRRNSAPVAETLNDLLTATRAHIALALQTGGEQALANVLHVAELARQYEIGGGISFRGFVDELRRAAQNAQAAEAPILEEDSDGVRMMTVHKAKGLEFPVVILVDPTCKLSRPDASRWINPEGTMCAQKLAGWTPIDLLLHGREEAERDRAEGHRLAYVASTRARDLLVIPVVGDEVYEGGWLDPLMPALYPPYDTRRRATPAPGCPPFPSKDSVLLRPEDDPARSSTVAPGRYVFCASSPDGPAIVDRGLDMPRDSIENSRGPGQAPLAGYDPSYSVVWWDPHVLALKRGHADGLRREDLIAKDGDQQAVTARLATFEAWRSERADAIGRARVPSVIARTVTELAADRAKTNEADYPVAIEVVDLVRATGRPFGPNFGSLVHATLATTSLDAIPDAVGAIARTQGRVLGATDEEVAAAAAAVVAALGHSLFDRIRASAARGKCDRELPIIWPTPERTLVEGTIDLVFEDDSGVVVLDFKTDRELEIDRARYDRQLRIYCRALHALRGLTTRGVLMKI